MILSAFPVKIYPPFQNFVLIFLSLKYYKINGNKMHFLPTPQHYHKRNYKLVNMILKKNMYKLQKNRRLANVIHSFTNLGKNFPPT